MTSRSTGTTRRPAAKLRAILAPLGTREEKAATKAALGRLRQDGKLAADARFRTVRVVPAIEKPERRGAEPQRLIEVVVADYTARAILRTLIDVRGRVLRSEELSYQPPYHPDEIEEAQAIARSDRRVAGIARTARVFASPFVPAAQERERSRLVGLRYAAPAKDGVAHVGTAVVDLSTGKLVSFEGATGRS